MPPRNNKNQSFLMEVWTFVKERKAWWLAPVLLVLLLSGAAIFFGAASPLSAFIYPLF